MGLGLARFRGIRTFAAGALLICAAIEAYSLTDRREPGYHDIRRYVLGEIFDTYRVEQRFFVKADGLSSVTVHPRPASPAPTGNAILTLRDVTDEADPGIVHRASVPLAELARMESFTMRFPPQRSRYRAYLLEVTTEGSSDGQGIGLLAARGGSLRGDNYRGPTLWMEGRRRFGNLVFDTTVNGAMSNFESIAATLGRGGVPAPSLVLFLVLIGKYVALFVIIVACAHPAGAAALAGRTPPSLPV